MLRALNEGGIHSTAELARRLGLSEGMVGRWPKTWHRHGYLAGARCGCASGCTGWVPASACHLDRTVERPAKRWLFAYTGQRTPCGKVWAQTENWKTREIGPPPKTTTSPNVVLVSRPRNTETLPLTANA